MFGWGKNLLICKGELFFETESHGFFILFAVSEGAHQLGKNLKLYVHIFIIETSKDLGTIYFPIFYLEKSSDNILFFYPHFAWLCGSRNQKRVLKK